MIVNYFIQYFAHYGEGLVIKLYDSEENTWPMHVQNLEYMNPQYWCGVLDLDELDIKNQLFYSCSMINNTGAEYVIVPKTNLDIKYKKKSINVYQQIIQQADWSAVYHTRAFDILLKKQKHPPVKHKEAKKPTHIFKVMAPQMQARYAVCITGSGKLLNDWEKSNPLLLEKKKNGWALKLSFAKEKIPVEYKLAVYDLELKTIVYYEEGDNRLITNGGDPEQPSILILNAAFDKYSWRGTGVNVPVFSLRSANSWGIGDFSDLALLTDWALQAGINMIQLLPVNDTTATSTEKDSYPYSAISPFALHPLYLDLNKLALNYGYLFSNEIKESIKQVNEKKAVDYESVLQLKTKAIKLIYANDKNAFKDDFAFMEFFDVNRHWLVPYAVFCYLRDTYGSADFNTWKQLAVYSEEAVQEFASPDTPYYDEICIHYYIQFHLHLQLKDAVDFAHKKGIIFKGDLPIGIGRHSVDSWMYPQLFHMDLQAGAPPDYYSKTGQNWNFPTYNWEAMSADGYKWWRQRMEHLGNYFDAIRIDHVLGFFRIWSIPLSSIEGTLGFFQPVKAMRGSLLAENGIHFNYDRFCKPYITDHILKDDFGDDMHWVKDTFMYAGNFKEEYTTQQAIVKFFKANPQKKQLQNKLMDLLTDVILLPADKEDYYHFRIGMQQTRSYQHLPGFEKSILDRLYELYFFKDQNDLWEQEGVKKLEALKSTTDMLLCAEDLGMIPEFMDRVLHQLYMLSLKVQRMPKKATDHFSDPQKAPYLSVVTTATHDMSTMREWWEQERENIQSFFNETLGHYGAAPFYCEPWIATDIINQHLQAPAMWAVFLLQDLLAIDGNIRSENVRAERINNPADPNHVWNYRMHLNLEDMMAHSEFTHKLKEMVLHSGR